MKKSLEFTAAAVAAIMAMSCTSLTALAKTTSGIANDDTGYVDSVTGGWEVTSSYSLGKNPEAKAAFKKATKDRVGLSCKPLAVLGTQVVMGTNYAILCRSTAVSPEADPEICIMYINEDFEGGAEIIGFKTIIGEQSDGGFTVNKGNLAISKSKNKKVYSACQKALEGVVGVSYKPVAYLGSQLVAGNNYLILCRSKTASPEASYEWSLVTVYIDLEGKVSLGDIDTLDLGDMDAE